MPWRFWRRALVPLSMLVAVMPALAGDTALPTTAPNDARAWLAAFSPWRALLAAHLWAAQSAAAP